MENSTKKSKIIDSAPGFLRDILPYISPRIFDLMDVPIVALNMGKLSYQFLFSKGVSSLKNDLYNYLPNEITFDFTHGKSSEKEFGESLLELYFTQILVGKGVFLDLRPKCFSVNNGSAIWSPNGLHCELSSNFIKGLQKLYTGFYLKDADLYKSGLIEIGLISLNDSEETQSEMMKIFNEHFGDGSQEDVSFEMKHFTDSFHKVFDKIFHQNKQLNEDFVYLGIYLVTLYLHLEKLGGSYNVRRAFMTAQSKVDSIKSNP